ncbi:MAG: arsenate reductase ArsC [Candidatus Bathyarchaeia archaeon]
MLTKTVLFVCVENAARSQMAEAFFNTMAPKGLRALSAGTRPAERVNPKAVEVMREVGIDISIQRPKNITQDMIKKANRIITMGCGAGFCPSDFLPKIEDWELDDPAIQPLNRVREIRDEIRRRVEDLIASMS